MALHDHCLNRLFGDRRAPDGSLVSENFSRWFSESAVQKMGLPQVMYHGTSVFENGMGDLNEFDRLWTVHNLPGREAGIDNVGSWFTNNPGAEGGAQMYSSSQGVIYPVYLSISKPYVTTFDLLVRRMHHLNGEYSKADAPHRVMKGDVDNLRYWLRNCGMDGIRLIHDPSRGDYSTEFVSQDVWIPLQANQIKSAIGNSGVFDPDSTTLDDAHAWRSQEKFVSRERERDRA